MSNRKHPTKERARSEHGCKRRDTWKNTGLKPYGAKSKKEGTTGDSCPKIAAKDYFPCKRAQRKRARQQALKETIV